MQSPTPVSKFSYFFGSTEQQLAMNSLECSSDFVKATTCGRVVVCVVVVSRHCTVAFRMRPVIYKLGGDRVTSSSSSEHGDPV